MYHSVKKSHSLEFFKIKFQSSIWLYDTIFVYKMYIVIYMANFKNILGVKKVQGQSEAACKQANATKSFDISRGQALSKNF